MTPLHESLRRLLERTVRAAHDSAHEAAAGALQGLAVHRSEPFPEMSAEARALRVTLRARARHLGGRTQMDQSMEIEPLVEECAYEHWHRMLFARYLAENHLLIHPSGVAVTLEECEDLAAGEGAADGWELAARYAASMLPAIFKPEDPVLRVVLAREHQNALQRLLADLPPEVFTADDSLGWVYQFWQAKRKDEVNQAGGKVGANELPAVTQLFTEHYMVLFLLHNTLGAWWAARHPGEEPPVDLTYLRSDEAGDPAAGGFARWPSRARDLRVLDPCCGSGHFLVAAFDMLARMRMREEGLSATEAADAVLRENVYGLELDPRCTQIAAFALALAAWRFGGEPAHRSLPEDGIHIACSGLGINTKKEEWLRLAPGEGAEMERLHRLFSRAPLLGSLIEVEAAAGTPLLAGAYTGVRSALEVALRSEKARKDAEAQELGVRAKGIAEAAEILRGTYHLIATNVPYLARGKQDPELKDFCAGHYPDAKADLATVFVDRCLKFCEDGGAVAVVTPQNWLFLGSYKKLRERWLREESWNVVARLGPGAFETISGEIVNVALLILTHAAPSQDHPFAGLDASGSRVPAEKATLLRDGPVQVVAQASQLRNPDARVSLADSPDTTLMSAYANGVHGLGTKDSPRFYRSFWELPLPQTDWELVQTTVEFTQPWGGLGLAVFWQNGAGVLHDLGRSGWAVLAGGMAWHRPGVAISQMRHLPASLYSGEIFDKNVAVISPRDPAHLPAVWAFCSSPEFHDAVRRIDQTLKVTNASLVKVPFDLERWQKVADEMGPLPEPYSEDPTQWLFDGRVIPSMAPLQVAVARLLGYRWPDQKPEDLDELADEDGVICIPPVRGERSAAERLRTLLARAHGAAWSASTEARLLAAVGFEGKTLEDWLRNGFFEQHLRLFHNRPFLWHVYDGRRDGFSAIVNYHRLDRRLLERLAHTYVGDWIDRQRDQQSHGDATAEARVIAATELRSKLEKILEGEAPYDIFVRWKPIEQQPIGWDPDLNDGVRLNIRPFVQAEILRKRPHIDWKTDRGKNPPGSPWGEDRINDRHLTLSDKHAARSADSNAVLKRERQKPETPAS